MKGIVFVPGISGSELIFQNMQPPIWPPKWDDLFVYRELDELLDPNNVSIGNVIDEVDWADRRHSSVTRRASWYP